MRLEAVSVDCHELKLALLDCALEDQLQVFFLWVGFIQQRTKMRDVPKLRLILLIF